MIGPRTRSSGTRSVPKRKRSSWYSSRRFSVRDLDRPLMVDQRAEEVVQPDERLAHTRTQVDAIVEGAALAALVAPDVRLPDGRRPVDRVEERDGLVADGLQAGQGHLDELPLDEVEQARYRAGARASASGAASSRRRRPPPGTSRSPPRSPPARRRVRCSGGARQSPTDGCEASRARRSSPRAAVW